MAPELALTREDGAESRETLADNGHSHWSVDQSIPLAVSTVVR